MFNQARATVCLSSALVLLASGRLLAADSPLASGEDLTLEEVTVTAERVEKDLQKTPQFITVKSGAQLKAEGKTHVEDILQGVVGLNFEPNSNGLDNNIFMRGVSNGAVGVSIVLDGVAQTVIPQSVATTFRFTSLDMAQVAVARGVQNGAGVSALSGTVSLVTNKPVFELQALGSVTTGSYKTQNTEGTLNLPITGHQAVRLAFTTERHDAYASSGQGEVDNRAMRLRYRWQQSDSLDINATYQESRTNGTAITANSTLFTGRWQTLPGGGSLNYTNPYSGVVTTWGQQIPGRQIYSTGNVLAGFTAATAATNTVGVGTLGINATNASLTTNNQFYYPAPLCSANSAFTAASTVTSYASPAALQTALAALGPASVLYGCPFNMMALRDGVDWNQRSNPWDDGFRPGQFFNAPSTNTRQQQANITVDWTLAAGTLQLQPSYLSTKNYTIPPARGTGWNEVASPPQTAWRLDSSFTSKMLGAFQYIVGFNGTLVPQLDDGYPSGPGSRNVTAALQPWVTANTLPTATNGVTPNGGAVSLVNQNCYSVLPSLSTALVTQATSKGVVNNSSCAASNYTAGTSQRTYSFTTDLRYTVRDRLHLNGTIRFDQTSQQLRNNPFAFLVDTDGQRYVYVLPGSTTAPASAANPNSPYAMPYRMNISARDLQALADAYPAFSGTSTGKSFTLNAQYDVTPSISTYARLATGTTASMQTDAAGRVQTSFNVDLPDAQVPLFSGNASAAALARSGLPYQVTVTGIPDGTRFLPGEQTRQISYGLKSRWFDNRVQVNLEGFYNKFTNRSLTNIVGTFPTDVFSAANNPNANQICNAAGTAPTTVNPFVIVLDPNGTPTSRGSSCFNTFQGAGGSPYTGILVSKGVDVDVSWAPTSNDRLDVTGELLSTQFAGGDNLPKLDSSFLKPYVVSGSNDALLDYYAGVFNDYLSGVRGLQLANAPKMTINTTYQHRFLLGGTGSLVPRIQYNYSSAKYISNGGAGVPTTDASTVRESNWAIDNGRSLPTVVPKTGIWNIFVTYQPANSKWSVNAYVNNVRNTAVLTSVQTVTSYSTGSFLTNDLQRVVTGGNATLGAPRVIGLTLSAQL